MSEINVLVYMRKWQALVGTQAEILPVVEDTRPTVKRGLDSWTGLADWTWRNCS